MTEIPRQVLSEHLEERLKGRVLKTAVFFTFQLDPGFFEQEVLPVFLDVPLSHEPAVRLIQLEDALRHGVGTAVYYDPRGVVAGAESAKLDVRRIPVSWPTGYFHAKNVFLLVEDAEPEEGFEPEQRLIVATLSANLTRNGWWENVEVCHTEELAPGEKTRLRGDLLALFRRVKTACPDGTDHSALDSIRRYVLRLPERLQQTAGGVLHTRMYVGAADGSRRQESVPEFLGLVKNTGRLRLEVISPFFDDTAKAGPLLELIERFEPVEVRVFLPTGPDGKALCRGEYYDAVESLPNTSWGRLPKDLLSAGKDESAAQRRVHAKVYRFFDPRERYEALLVGSPNLTNAAHQGGGNFETAFLVEPSGRGKPDWWLSGGAPKPKEFQETSEEEVPPPGPGRSLVIRYRWDTGRASARWEAGGTSPALRIEAQGSHLFDLRPLRPGRWTSVEADAAGAVGEVLRSTSFLTVVVKGTEPATILVLEEGMAHKPSILLNLSVADILRCWAALTPEQKSALFEERYAELGESMSVLLPKGPLGRQDIESLFDAFAGAFHAFGALERKVFKALDEGRKKEAVYLLFGAKYDSLPHLLSRLAKQDERLDAVHRYVLVLCARQVLDRVKREASDFAAAHRQSVKKLEGQLEALSSVRQQVAVEPDAERESFLAWYEAWFLKRAELPPSEGS